jgi:aspartate kinase
MSLLVIKFGGTSLETVDLIRQAALQVKALYEQQHQVVVVVSAMAGETNRLVALTRALTHDCPASDDIVISTGEQVTTGLFEKALAEVGCQACALQGWQLPIITTADFSKARIQTLHTEKIETLLNQGIIPVIPGFQGISETGAITTLGRGGSDVTAVALAAVLKAEACWFYKDVPGILSCDPKVVPQAQLLDEIAVEELFEQASQGAKILHPRALELARNHKVCLAIKPTFHQTAGTQIVPQPLEVKTISGIVCNEGEVLFTLQHIPTSPGALMDLFAAFETAEISLDMIAQDGQEALRFTIADSDKKTAARLVEAYTKQYAGAQYTMATRIAKVSLIGSGLRGHASVARTVYQTLGELGINLYGIVTTELKMSLLISSDYAQDLVRALHTNFFDVKGSVTHGSSKTLFK